ITSVNHLEVKPILAISPQNGIEVDYLIVSLNGFIHNLEIIDNHESDFLSNQERNESIIWKKNVTIETQFLLPFLIYSQSVSITGRTKLLNFVDTQNFQLESEIVEVSGLKKSVFWVHLFSEIHLLLLIVYIVIILIRRIKPSREELFLAIFIPTLGAMIIGFRLMKQKNQSAPLKTE
ncbi:MAG TPA: hypothetical protein VIN11_02345, partial [Roseivirga sp.]